MASHSLKCLKKNTGSRCYQMKSTKTQLESKTPLHLPNLGFSCNKKDINEAPTTGRSFFFVLWENPRNVTSASTHKIPASGGGFWCCVLIVCNILCMFLSLQQKNTNNPTNPEKRKTTAQVPCVSWIYEIQVLGKKLNVTRWPQQIHPMNWLPLASVYLKNLIGRLPTDTDIFLAVLISQYLYRPQSKICSAKRKQLQTSVWVGYLTCTNRLCLSLLHLK